MAIYERCYGNSARSLACRGLHSRHWRSASRVVQVVSLLMMFHLLNVSYGYTISSSAEFLEALSRAATLSDRSLGQAHSAVEPLGSDLNTNIHGLHSKFTLPIVLRHDVELASSVPGTLPATSATAGVAEDISLADLPGQAIQILEGTQLTLRRFRIRGLRQEVGGPSGKGAITLFADRLLNQGSRGTLVLNHIAFEFDSCSFGFLERDGMEHGASFGEEGLRREDPTTATTRLASSNTEEQRRESGSSGIIHSVPKKNWSNGDNNGPEIQSPTNHGGSGAIHNGAPLRGRTSRQLLSISTGRIQHTSADPDHAHEDEQSTRLKRSSSSSRGSGVATATGALSERLLTGRLVWRSAPSLPPGHTGGSDDGPVVVVLLNNITLRCAQTVQDSFPQHQQDLPRVSSDSTAEAGATSGQEVLSKTASVRAAESEAEEQDSALPSAVRANRGGSGGGAGRRLRAAVGGLTGSGRALELLARGGEAPEHLRHGRGFTVAAQLLVASMLVVALVGGMWLKRLLSCTCMRPPSVTAPVPEPAGVGSRSLQKGSTPMGRNSQNHTLSALSRFSAALRKGEDVSVRDGSMALRPAADVSTRGGTRNREHQSSATGMAVVAEPPLLVKELSDLKPAGRGRLATTLSGIWQKQQRVMVKVLSHGEDCSFMLEQVGEVWSRLMHPNIVTCLASDTFAAACVANLPQAAELLPEIADPAITMQTWIVLEHCQNGSLASMLAQRYQMHATHGRKGDAAAGAAGAGGAGAGDGSGCKDDATARHVARRLGRFSRGRHKVSAVSGGGSGGPDSPEGGGGAVKGTLGTAVSVPIGADPGPLPAPTGRASPVVAATVCGEYPSGPKTSPAPLVTTSQRSRHHVAIERSATTGFAGSGPVGSGGSAPADNAEGGSSPGLLPVAEVLSVALDIASGLAYLHSLDLCHGDLRAENVMVQTVVLPSSARSGGDATTGSGAAATIAVADRPGGNSNVSDHDNGNYPPGHAFDEVDGGAAIPDVAVTDLVAPGLRAESSSVAALESQYGSSGGGGSGEGDTAAVANGQSAIGRGLDEGIAMVYGSAVVGGAAARAPFADVSCPGTAIMNATSCGATDSCAHAWSTSLRHSNGFISSSTYTSAATNVTTAMGVPSQYGGGSRGVSARIVNEDAHASDRLPNAGSPSGTGARNGSGGGAWPGKAPAHILSPTAGRSQLGAAAVAAAGDMRFSGAATCGGVGVGLRGVADGSSVAAAQPSLNAMSTSAIAALSRGIGLNSSLAQRGGPCNMSLAALAGPSASFMCSSPFATGGAVAGSRQSPFITRRQSNGSLSANNTNSGTEVAAMSKALSGLTAWPESPQEGRHGADGPNGALSKVASGRGGGDYSGSGGAAPLASTCSGGPRAAGPLLSPGRKPLVVGGLKSAFAAPAMAELPSPPPPPPPPPAAPPPPPLMPNTAFQAAVVPPPRMSAFAAPHVQAQDRSRAYSPGSSTAVLTAARLPSDLADCGPESPAIAPRAAMAGAAGAGGPSAAAASSVVCPRIVTLQLDSPVAISPVTSPRGAATNDGPPSSHGAGTPTANGNHHHCNANGLTDKPSSPTSGGRSRSAVGLVCNIGGHQNRRCSAPPLVALPVIRRVAKLTDPWVSLARLPSDCAGGPWSPEAAEALGATSGADVAHLPPELLLSGRLHPSSDVYSLGVLMWRMMSPTGEAPYAKLQPAEVAYKVVACGMRPAFSPAVPEPLRRLVEECWQSDPGARPTVQQVLQRLTELQSQASTLQRQWRDRHALFGAVSTVPISAVAVLPLAREHNDIASRWAEAAGIRLLRTSCSWGGSAATAAAAAAAAATARGDLCGHASFGQNSSRNPSGTFAMPSFPSACASGSAAHIYAQPPPPTPPGQGMGGLTSQFHMTTAEFSSHLSHTGSEAAVQTTRGSQSNHQPKSPNTGHLPVQPYRQGGAALDPF